MIEVRSFEKLAGADRGWLKAKMHFDFAGLGHADHPPCGVLRVWNDDEFAPSSGFPMHPHSNIEILTYVREGAITHEDSLGNRGVIRAGDVQVMSAGTGIRHSEFNAGSIPAKLFQIWLATRSGGTLPHWNTRSFPPADRAGRLVALASSDVHDEGALRLDADARVLGGTFAAGSRFSHGLPRGRRAYIVSTLGRVDLNGARLAPRDGAAITGEHELQFTMLDDTELIVVEVA